MFLPIIFLALIVPSFGETMVDIVISARNLPNKDPFNGAPDAYAMIYTSPNPSTDFIYFGETEHIEDNSNPDWDKKFRFFVQPDTIQRFRVKVVDDDAFDHDDIGDVEFGAAEFLSAGNSLEKNLNPSGSGKLIFKLVKTEMK